MKRGAPNHPKMKALARALNVPLPMAVGMMEMLWHFAAQYAPAGDIGKFDDGHIEEECGWDRWPGAEAGLFVRVALSTGWLEEHPTCRLTIHDWSEHADDAIHMKLARGRAFFADGSAPKIGRLPKNERDTANEYFTRTAPAHAVHTPCASRAASPPPPVPRPALPRQSPAPPVPGRAERGASSAPAAENSSGVAAPTAAPLPTRAAVVPITAPPPAPPPPPPKPKPPLEPLPDDEPDRAALAASAVDAMLKQHWALSNRAQALWEVEQVLASAVHPERTIEAMQRTHAEHVHYRKRNPQCKRNPPLQYWIRDGDYLHGPPTATEAAEPEDKVTIAMRMLAERSRERGQKLANG